MGKAVISDKIKVPNSPENRREMNLDGERVRGVAEGRTILREVLPSTPHPKCSLMENVPRRIWRDKPRFGSETWTVDWRLKRR